MTENETIDKLKCLRLFMEIEDKKNDCKFSPADYEAIKMAIKALEDVQQYRDIGTVEELKQAQKYVRLSKNHGTIGQVIDACAEYEEIGTVEEFQTKVVDKWISVTDRLPDDGDCRFYMCLVENHIEDVPMMCQFEEEVGFGFYKDIYDPVSLGFVDTEFEIMEEIGCEKVMYWRQIPEPPKDRSDET